MTTTDALDHCRYCSLVSKANGEDPIGTAGTADHWLIMEIPQPWPKEMFTSHPLISQLLPLFKKLILRRGIRLRPIAIASDPEYSRPGYTRIIHYRRPQKYFARYQKQEYLVPEDKAHELAIALLNDLQGKGNNLSTFASNRQSTEHIRDVMVCTHTQVDLACGRFGTPLYRQLRQDYAQPNLRVWQSTHFGGHKFAPTMLDLPDGQFWGHLEPDTLDAIIHRRGDVSNLRSFYRGWAGLTQFEQIAERELWLQNGWQWFTFPRTGKIQRKGLSGIKKFIYPTMRLVPIPLIQMWLEKWTCDPDWVEVEIEYHDLHGSQQRYSARVETKGTVVTAPKSSAERGTPIETILIPQYRVSELAK